MHLIIAIHGPENEQKEFLQRLKQRVKKIIDIHEIKFYDILCYKEAEEEIKELLARQPHGAIRIPGPLLRFINLGPHHKLEQLELPRIPDKKGVPYFPQTEKSPLGTPNVEVIAILKVKDPDWLKEPGDGQEGI